MQSDKLLKPKGFGKRPYMWLLLSFYCWITIPVFSQTPYQAFPTTTARWSEASYGFSDAGSLYSNFGWYYQLDDKDTIIDNKNYHLLTMVTTWEEIYDGIAPVDTGNTHIELGYIGGIREDNEKKVFFYPFTDSWQNCIYSLPDTSAEFLLYDFGVIEGDTIPWGSYERIVTQIDSQQLADGIYYRRIILGDAYGEDFWLEGVGSNLGLFGAYLLPPFEGGCELSCFSKNGDYLITNRQRALCDSTNVSPLVSIPKIAISQLSIFPNPASRSLSIQVEAPPSSRIPFSIYNLLGQKIYEGEIINGRKELHQTQLGTNGLFFLKISDGARTNLVQEFVFH